jgi:hypothetical protein
VDDPQSEQALNTSKIPPDTTQHDNTGNTSIFLEHSCFGKDSIEFISSELDKDKKDSTKKDGSKDFLAANDVPESYLPIRAKSHSPKKKAQHQASDMVLKEFAKSLAFEDNEASVSNKVQISSSDSEEDYVYSSSQVVKYRNYVYS